MRTIFDITYFLLLNLNDHEVYKDYAEKESISTLSAIQSMGGGIFGLFFSYFKLKVQINNILSWISFISDSTLSENFKEIINHKESDYDVMIGTKNLRRILIMKFNSKKVIDSILLKKNN